MKYCYKCQTEKPLSEFSINKTRKDELSDHCRSCHKVMRRKHYENNKEKILEQVEKKKKEYKEWYDSLKNKPCKDCGNSYPPYVMDFDHLRDKDFSLSTTLRYSWGKKRILKEIEKCELVCSNCHRIRTHNRLIAPLA